MYGFGQKFLNFWKDVSFNYKLMKDTVSAWKLLNFLKRRKVSTSHTNFLTRTFRGRNFITQEMYGFGHKFLNFWKDVSFNYNSWKVRFRPENIKFSKKTLVSTSHSNFITTTFRGRNFITQEMYRVGQKFLNFWKDVSFNYNSWMVRFRPEIIKFSKKM
jgi:preprotein translocase subunit SecE